MALKPVFIYPIFFCCSYKTFKFILSKPSGMSYCREKVCDPDRWLCKQPAVGEINIQSSGHHGGTNLSSLAHNNGLAILLPGSFKGDVPIHFSHEAPAVPKNLERGVVKRQVVFNKEGRIII